jgi:hypothetical protein
VDLDRVVSRADRGLHDCSGGDSGGVSETRRDDEARTVRERTPSAVETTIE